MSEEKSLKKELSKIDNNSDDIKKDHNMVLDGHKMVHHLDRVKAWLRGERVAPITIDMALSRACNYNCIYCYGKLQENERHPLTREVLMNFIEDCAEIGVKGISLVSDGESTVHPDMSEFIIYGKKKGIDMALGTNGILLKEKYLKEILESLTYLRFNISAGEPKEYAHIMGTTEENFYKFCDIVKKCVKIKKENNLSVTIGLQMVLMPEFIDQVIPLSKLGKELGVDYLVIKHCTDNERADLNIDYKKYFKMENILKEAETYSTKDYLVKVKWHKILSGGIHKYTSCYGPPFMLQMSGSGLVAPCGSLFPERHKQFHIGNISKTRFKDLFNGERYWEIMKKLSSNEFDASKMCGHLCLQHYINEFLWDIKKGNIDIKQVNPSENKPEHINFI